jgi:hypothetical protein
MTLVARILIGLIALFFLVNGLRFFFTPDAMAGVMFIAPAGVAGLSTIRGDLGGAFFATGVFALLGMRHQATHWLYAAAGIIGAIALGRLFGFVFDGTVPNAVIGFIVEVVFVVVLLVGARQLAKP